MLELLLIIGGVTVGLVLTNLERRIDRLERGEFKDYQKGEDSFWE